MRREFIKHHDNYQTAIYISQNSTVSNQLAILVHGYGGNYFGLKWLAEELNQANWTTIIIELPCHGHSALRPIRSRQELDNWFSEALELIEQRHGRIELIVGHSFGCYVVANQVSCSKIATVLVNPVFKPSFFYQQSAQYSYNSVIATILQNLLILSPIKGLLLLKKFNYRAFRNLFWNTIHANPSLSQKLAQRFFLKIVLDDFDFRLVKNQLTLVINGKGDNLNQPTSVEELVDIFGKTPIIELAGGHLLPIEAADQVAKTILDIVDKAVD